MRLLILLLCLFTVSSAFGQLRYSNGTSPCCVVPGTNGTFSVVSGGSGITVSTYAASSSGSSTSFLGSTLTPQAAVLSGTTILVAGLAANATGFVAALPIVLSP